MSTSFTANQDHHPAPAQLIAVGRAVLALGWAAAVVLAIGNEVPRTDSDVPVVAAALLVGYPLIDVAASLLTAGVSAQDARPARVGAAISAVAVVAIAFAAFGADAGATLVAFGAWAAVSGALQLALALRRRGEGRQLPMIVSGGLSTLAGLSFIAAAGKTDASLKGLGGYMAIGALLYLVWAYRNRTAR